ncbi:MAG TPA: S8 family serine peptidase [Thermoanaerobaculia bacterium]|nr:S8 family serine peptidase [Thermoanaerobaculia bacterium]
MNPSETTVTHSAWRAELERISAGARGDARVRVAMIDGPVDRTHPALQGATLEFLESPAPNASASHGTSVASVLFGQPGSAIHGIVPHCHGLIVPVLRESNGMLAASQLDLARGIVLALAHRASIINISAGQFDPGGEAHPYLADALRHAREQGALVIAAAGNDGCHCLHVPAADPSVLAVGAIDDSGRPLPMSNWGAAYRDHGIVAPGSVLSAQTGGGAAVHTGTSWATAVVSGFAALLLCEQLQCGDEPDVRRVREAILETADRCHEETDHDCQRLLEGRLNAAAAWRRIRERRRTPMIEEMQSVVPAAMAVPISTFEVAAGPAPPPRVTPSCGCGGGSADSCSCRDKEKPAPESSCASKKAPPPLVYALGQLGYDFASEARRDSLIQQGLHNPYDPVQLLNHLESNPAAAAAVTWTLVQDSTPIYAIQPVGPFAAETYALLRKFLGQQLHEGVERISVPGWVGGKGALSNGQILPVIVPDPRGMFSWTTRALLEAVLGSREDEESSRERASELANFLDRIYFEVRNLGLLPQERAINYAATNAFQLGEVYTRNAKAGLKLDVIGAERSPICRPESDCWDVKLTFFHPARRLEQAREVFRVTVDVSDVVPVTVGPVRSWHVY